MIGSILFYEGPWDFLSNASSFAVEWQGHLCSTSEHAYQAERFLDKALRQRICEARSVHDAKKIAQSERSRIRGDWIFIKVGIMEQILRAKLEQHPHIRERLIGSGDVEIIKHSMEDPFWGIGPDQNGKNHLGKIWMNLREEARRN